MPCVLLQLLHVYSRKMSRLPELIRQQRKRALGQPRTGRMSLVMTDIQGFTGLMQEAPDHTTQVKRGGGRGEGRGEGVTTHVRVLNHVCKQQSSVWAQGTGTVQEDSLSEHILEVQVEVHRRQAGLVSVFVRLCLLLPPY